MQAEPLASRFRVTFAMILQMLLGDTEFWPRLEGAKPNGKSPKSKHCWGTVFACWLRKRFSQSGVQVEDLLGQSFLENARARRRPGGGLQAPDSLLCGRLLNQADSTAEPEGPHAAAGGGIADLECKSLCQERLCLPPMIDISIYAIFALRSCVQCSKIG